MDVTTTLIHGDDGARWDGSVTPSIAQGLNWTAESGDELRDVATTPQHPFFYSRHGNPNHSQVAAVLAQLEGAEAALVAASGMGAIATAALALVQAGDHVIGQRSTYAGVSELMHGLLPRLGVECTQVDQADVGAWEAALRPNTKLLLIETPSNPRLEVTDLAAVAELARAGGAITLADNTFATPINQRPLEHGIDLVWHSATKYLGGHADLLAGALCGSEEAVERIWRTLQVTGAVLAPMNAWLLLRGLRTLSLRMERHNANGLALAQALEGHPAVRGVHYAGLPSAPGHAVAARQMSGYGGVLSLELDGYEAADAFIGRLTLAKRAASLGAVGSLVVHPAAMWAGALSPEQLAEAGVPPGMVRFSAGIEHRDDLVADVLAALP